MKRDGATQSLWQEGFSDYRQSRRASDKDKIYDVLIVGGGITGLTTALLLQKAGKCCIVAEAATLGFGTTAGTSAHLNTFFDTPYSKVIKYFGEEAARLLVYGAKASVALIRQLIREYAIDCDFEEKDGYLFTVSQKQDKELDDLVETAQRLGLPIEYTDTNPFPIPYLKAARIREQAQFHPIAYLSGIAKAFERANGKLMQSCRVTAIEEGPIVQAQTTQGVLRARQVVYATHIPPGLNLLHLRCAPYRSYVVGVRLKGDPYPKVLGYDLCDPYHYYRTHIIGKTPYLLVGGEDHKTGHESDTEACFRRLESHVHSYFPVEKIAYRWSSQYFEPADGLPYIGRLLDSERIFVATGFGGNGMIYGTLSAITLANIIVNGKSIYQEMFDPNRLKPVAGFSSFVKENADVAKQFIAGKLAPETITEMTDLAAGEARVVKYEGKTLALYKDEQHRSYALDPTCPHAGCFVRWNSVEQSWDCPCHGSRFSCEGQILTGPAQQELKQIEVAGIAPSGQQS